MPASPPKLRRGLLRSRFTRRLLTAATILSLLLCLATVGLWVRSYWRQDLLQYSNPYGPLWKTPWVGLRGAFGEVLFAYSLDHVSDPWVMWDEYGGPASTYEIRSRWLTRSPFDRGFWYFG